MDYPCRNLYLEKVLPSLLILNMLLWLATGGVGNCSLGTIARDSQIKLNICMTHVSSGR